MKKDLAYTIIEESDHLSEIMLNLMIGMPQLFKVASYNSVKKLTIEAILNPDVPVVQSEYQQKYYDIISKKYTKGKMLPSEQQRLAAYLRNKVSAIVKGFPSSYDFLEQLGCSEQEFRDYIEKQFDETMSWDNYGINTWHIDHIKPLCSFDLTDLEQVKIATHFTNLRPLDAKMNTDKGRKEDRKLSIRKDLR